MAKKRTNVNIAYDGYKDELYAYWYQCENCKCDDILIGFNYCPNCGLKINEFIGEQREQSPHCFLWKNE